MENVMLDNAAIDMETQIAKYQDLSDQKNAVEERISRAESERPSVKDKIFQRVLREYEKELEKLNCDLTPLGKEIDAVRSDLKNKVKDIDIQTADLQDQIDEIAFRHRVGEFTDSQKAEQQAPIELECEELTQRGIDYVQTLEKFDLMELDTTDNKNAAVTEPAPADQPEIEPKDEPEATDENPADDPGTDELAGDEPAPADAIAPASKPEFDQEFLETTQEEEKLDVEPANEEEGFVNPSDWVGEFAEGDFVRAPAAPADEANPADEASDEDKTTNDGPGEVLGYSELDMNNPDESSDALSDLADPSDETDQPHSVDELSAEENVEEQTTDESGSAPQDSSIGFPVLSITKGAGAGKKLPLLPMTMTLGRELDNNIELKDQDVARYHARITYHAGEYVIHDLEGSSGTFVNGEKISKVSLAPGDTVRAGETELKFDLE